jgi:hypothetical protein
MAKYHYAYTAMIEEQLKQHAEFKKRSHQKRTIQEFNIGVPAADVVNDDRIRESLTCLRTRTTDRTKDENQEPAQIASDSGAPSLKVRS